ncbi:MAG: protein arginine kinase, partial [Planctomycetales bacterium]
MARTPGEWLRGDGPDSDIVMSSRIRLARNLSDYPFRIRSSEKDRVEIERLIQDAVFHHPLQGEILYLDVEELDELDRQFLVERHLISKEHAELDGTRAVAICSQEQISLMVNEEDHLRIQVMRSGLDLRNAWEEINRVDDLIEERLTYAFNPTLGYLTACPTNVGTGMRVSVMLHLPALGMNREIEKVFRSRQKINLAVRGFFGEGTKSMGDFYQISNQITLGRSEEELIKNVGDVIPVILEYERDARENLRQESLETLHDKVSRAYAILQKAQTISSEETMHLLSNVRMGVNLGLIEDLQIPRINELFIYTQPAHLQKLRGSEMDTVDRNI